MVKSINRSLINHAKWLRFARAVLFLLKSRYAPVTSKELLGSENASDSSANLGPPLTGHQKTLIRSDVRSIEFVAAFPWKWAHCLQKSRALVMLLSRHGIMASLRIGVRKNGDNLAAHAWVEFDGIVLNDNNNTPKEYSILLPASNVSFDAHMLEWKN